MKQLILLILSCIFLAKASAQTVLIDEGVQVAGLWCFPEFGDSNQYRYLPSSGQLSQKQGKPEFSYLRYMIEKPGTGSENAISEADGGAILHFLVEYHTPAKQIKKAQAALQERLDNDKLKIIGPVAFENARYTLISSILDEEQKETTQLIGTGNAPLFENSKLAFSFELDPTHSTLMLESFKMNTPDISLIFELTFAGFSGEYDALLEIDWAKIQQHESFNSSVKLHFLGGEIEKGFEELHATQAIKLIENGENANLNALMNTVYSKLMEILFEAPRPLVNPTENGLDDLTKSIAKVAKRASPFSASASYKKKQLKTSGKATLSFKGRTVVKRQHLIAFNIGNLYKRYADDPSIFKDVPLWDPAFQQREILVNVDGTLEPYFENMINGATVTLKKQHQDGSVTSKQLLINQRIFTDSLGRFSLRYLNHGDSMQHWLNYDYQVDWQFSGGGSYKSEWINSSSAMINLYTPFYRKKINVEGNMETLKLAGVRMISVKLKYPFFNEQKITRINIGMEEEPSQKAVEITLPNGTESVDFDITWIKEDQSRPRLEGRDQIGLIFIDELP